MLNTDLRYPKLRRIKLLLSLKRTAAKKNISNLKESPKEKHRKALGIFKMLATN